MLNKNPSKRPRLQQIMKEPFFAEIDWDKLEKRQLEPPVVLKRSKGGDTQQDLIEKEQEEMAMLFEAPDHDDSIDDQRGGGKPCLLDDTDYTEDNRTYNRVKNYSFART